MKVLVMSGTDAANLHIINICRELQHRGHKMAVYSFFDQKSSDYMFYDLGLPIYPFSSLTPQIVSIFNIALCGDGGMAQLINFDIYTFVYTLAIDERVTNGADFLFNYCTDRRSHYYQNCASMAIGNPKNDSVNMSISTAGKRILYIDSGHIPFGKKGKEEIADLLLRICEENQDYELVIKPRWLRAGSVSFTHKNTEHIYDILEERANGALPSNLVMLNQHLDLHELINSSESVLTLYSSVIMDVLSHQKALVIITGYDCEDQIDFRTADFKRKEEFWGQSGCTVNIKEVPQFMPHGIQSDGTFLRKILPDVTGASTRAADVMGFVYKNYVRKKTYPGVKEYSYSNFKEELPATPDISWEQIKKNRIENMARYNLAILQDKISWHIDLSECYNFLLANIEQSYLSHESLEDFLRKLSYQEFVVIKKNKDQMMLTGIDQALLLQALYETGDLESILSLNEGSILCPEIYHYYLGIIHKQREDFANAAKHLMIFIESINTRHYDKYPQENIRVLKPVYNFLIEHYGINSPDKALLELFEYAHQNGNQVYSDFKLRNRVYQQLPKIAERVKEKSIEEAYRYLLLYVKYSEKYHTAPLRNTLNSVRHELEGVYRSRSYRFGKKVMWVPHQTKKFLSYLKEYGCRYTCTHLYGKIKNYCKQKKDSLMKESLVRIAIVFFKQVLPGYRLYKDMINKYGLHSYLFLSAPATGDAYIYGLFYKSFVAQNYPDYTPVYGVYGKSSVSVAKLFGIENSEAYSMDEFRQLYNLMMFDLHGKIHLRSLHYHVFYRHSCILSFLEGLHGFDFFSLAAACCQIQSDEDIAEASFHYDDAALNKMFADNELIKGKTILLSPFAKTIKSIPERFWKLLAIELMKHGFCVCTNSVGDFEPPVEGTKAIFIPYDLSVPFLERAGFSIGLRSGFHDVTSLANCLKIAIYPKNNYRRSLVCHINDSFLLSSMYGQQNQHDFIYSPENEIQLLRDIVSMVLSAYNTKKEGGQLS